MPHSLPTNHYCRHKTSISIVLRFLSLQLFVHIFSLICTADLNAQQHKNTIYYLSVYTFTVYNNINNNKGGISDTLQL